MNPHTFSPNTFGNRQTNVREVKDSLVNISRLARDI